MYAGCVHKTLPNNRTEYNLNESSESIKMKRV